MNQEQQMKILVKIEIRRELEILFPNCEKGLFKLIYRACSNKFAQREVIVSTENYSKNQQDAVNGGVKQKSRR